MQDFEQNRDRQGINDLRTDDPVLLLIARGKCHRACRTDLFCPHPSCNVMTKTNSELLTHLNKKHEDTECRDLLRRFLEGMCPSRIHIKPITGDGTEVDRQWDVERCPCPGCDCFQRRHPSLDIHIKTHTRMCANMEALR
jgi:hypothetical protein